MSSGPVRLRRSEEAKEMFRALCDALWSLDNHYVYGARAIIAHAVDTFQNNHPEMKGAQR